MRFLKKYFPMSAKGWLIYFVAMGLASALCALLFAVNAVPGMDMVLELPDDIYVDEAGGAERLCGIPAPFSITDRDGVAVANDLSERLSSAKNGEVKRFSVELFGVTVKNVDVHVRDDIYVMPCGSSVGISLWCNGVLVVGLGCENNQVEAFRETLGEFDPQRVHFMEHSMFPSF